MAQVPRVMPSNVLRASEVVNAEGNRLGSIESFGIDLERGRIAYVVLSLSGFLDIEDKYIAVPWEALRYSPNDQRVILNGDEQFLRHAPGFPKDNWPDIEDQNFIVEVYRYYGWKAYWEEN